MESSELNNKAKKVAIEGVAKRIVTKEQAKEDFKNWIKKTSYDFTYNGFDDSIADFWNQVFIEIDNV